jgi:peptide chain release factor 3
MSIEQQRGISVSSSVLNFPFAQSQFNLVDTPGHQDFCEDTYRALTAVDSALVLIDSVNGVEKQTIKLMEVCRMRKTPIITFINKMDLDGRDVVELLDEIEDILQIKCAPFTLPIGYGKTFYGVYSIQDDTLHTIGKDGEQTVLQMEGIEDPRIDEMFEERYVEELRERYDLVTGVMDPFDKEAFLRGEMCPVFFGSAIRNFGVKQLLEAFSDLAPSPLPRETEERVVDPVEEKEFSAFVFKIQANMDPRHRDRTAFMRICSGKFERGMKVLHCRTGKSIKLAAPTSFLAQNKQVVDDAWAGDIVGINDPGFFNIGDTLTTQSSLKYLGIPDFAPEFFARVVLKNPLKSKQMSKGLHQLSEEGATQLFMPEKSPVPVIGVVGELQFEVLEHRLEEEYGAQVMLERMPVYQARWVVGEAELCEKFLKEYAHDCMRDKKNSLVCLFPNEYRLNLAEKDYPDLQFAATSGD